MPLGRWTAALFIALASPDAAAVEAPRSGQPVFDRATELVNRDFFDESRLDRFNAAVRAQINDPKAPLTADSPEPRVDAGIDAVLQTLQASHTARFKPDTIAYYELADIFRFALRRDIERVFPPEGRPKYAGIGMLVSARDDRLFVSDVYDGSPAQRAGIRVGDEVLSLDGAPYHEIESFRGKAGRNVEIALRRHADAEPITVKVRVEALPALATLGKAIRDSISVFERGGRTIGYVRLWTLSDRDAMESIASELADGRLKDADGLVLDLRGRWGGGAADAAELFVGGTPTFHLIPRRGRAVLANVRWDRPVVGIIDAGARSGLELFAYALKANGIPLLGETTAGAFLGGRGYLLPDDSLLVLAVSDAVIGADIRLEGRGVAPDIEVPFALPYAAGRDPQREAAVEKLMRMLQEG